MIKENFTTKKNQTNNFNNKNHNNKPTTQFEYLSGPVERITYHNLENGFCVIRIKVKGHRDLVTLTGSVPSITVGEYIQSSGKWINNREYGLQFMGT